MNYALAYAPKGASHWRAWNGTGEVTKGSFRGLEGKEEFLATLVVGDSLFADMGGGSEKLCLAAVLKDIAVFRLPNHRFLEQCGRETLERSERAVRLMELAERTFDLFYSMRAQDEKATLLRVLIDAYETIQRSIRIPTQLRLQGIQNDLGLVGSEEFQGKIRDRFAPRQIFAEALEYEKFLRKEIESLLRTVPVYEIFDDISGIGPLIAARLIAYIGDIRRFPKVGHLKAYAGWHVDAEGNCPRRKKGSIHGWNPQLKMTFYLWIDQVNRHDPEKDPWKAMLIERKAYERSLHPTPVKVKGANGDTVERFTDGHIQARAARHVIQKLIEQVLWPRWRKLESLQ